MNLFNNGLGKDVNARLSTPGKYKLNRIVYEDAEILKKLADLGMYPGTEIEIIPDNNTVISNENGEIKLSLLWAKTIRLVR